MAAAGGATHWSEPLALDGLGAAAVVTLPAPLQGLAGRVDAPHAAVILTVTARQVCQSAWVFPCLLAVCHLWLVVAPLFPSSGLCTAIYLLTA